MLAIAQYKAMATTTFIAEDMGLTATQAGWISGIFTFTGIILAFPAAVILKKLGPKMTLILSTAFAVVGGIIGFFYRVQVFALHVLDDRKQHVLLIGKLFDY